MSEHLPDVAHESQSTTLDDNPGVLQGAGAPADTGDDKGTPEPEAPKSRAEALEAAAREADAKEQADPKGDEQPEQKGEKEPKEDEGEDEKEPKEAPKPREPKEGDDTRPKVEKPAADPRYKEAPQRFTPRAKEVWANTPNAVKADVLRIEREYEDVVAKTREIRQEWDKLSPFDDMARKSGTTLDVALSRYVEMESALRENPIKGIDTVLRNINPQFSLEGFVQQLTQNPELLRNALNMPSQRPQPEPVNPEVEEWKQRAQAAERDKFEQTVIAPFAAKNPRFEELQENIAQLLNSGMVPHSSDPMERLEIAYDMAVRLNPVSRSGFEATYEEERTAPPAKPLAGKKSISGAPSPGMKSPAVRGKSMSRKAALEAAIASSGG